MIQIIDTSGVLHPLSNYEDFHITHMQDGSDTCSFILDTSLPEYTLIREEAVIRTYENEYLIKKIDDDKVDCKLNFDFLKQRFYKEYVSETKSLAEVLTRHLPSGWTIEGLNVSTIRRTIRFDLCTDYDVIMDCIGTYGVYFIWHILAKRLVVVKPDLMNPTGEYVTSELNLRKLSFKGKSVDFATRLYAYGKDGMTMEDAIIDGQRYGLEYVENTTYSSKLIIAYWKDERYTVPENLHDDAVEKLNGLSWPVRSYECKIDDLAKQDERYSFLDFAMHKVISLLDSDRGIAVNHQIEEYDEWPDEPRKNSVTLSCVAGTIQNRIRTAADNGGKDAAEAVRQELESFINGEYSETVADLESQIDGKAETWYQAADPSTGWTVDEKAEHTGDLWYKTTDNTTWRWTGSLWAQQYVPDSVFDAIDGKASIYVVQPTPPYNVGDLWFNSSTSDILTCTTARATGSFTASDWEKRNKYTDDSAAEHVQENLDNAVDELEGKITDGDSAVSAALAERLNVATAMLTSAFGSYCYSENGELFMMDNPDPAEAQIVWRWNVNGFGKSSTGIDGPYTTALTFDDTFITGVVNAMIIRGDLIEANSISAEKIKQTYTDGVLSEAFTAAQGYVDALFVDLNNYLSNTDGTGRLDVIVQDIADIQATIDGLNIDFTEAFRGGINYAKNSAGLNGLSDDWTTTGTVVTMQSSDTKNSTVSNSCFRLSVDAQLSQTIDSVVLGQPYTISCKVKKTGTLLSEVYVIYNGGTVGKLFSSSDASGWNDYKFTIDAIASNTLQIVATTRSDYLFVSDIMVCEGVTSKAWTPAPDEIYTSGVKIDKRGITVYRSGTDERTVINNEEFAGYYGDEEVFSLNKDETRINKAVVRGELQIEDVKFIPFESGGEKGLNIALID